MKAPEIVWAVVLLISGAILSAYNSQWLFIGCAVGAVTANVIMIRIERRDRKRHAEAMARSWPQLGTVRSDGTFSRDGRPGYEVWDGKAWVKV